MQWDAAKDRALKKAVVTHGERWRRIKRLLDWSESDDALRNRYRRMMGAPQSKIAFPPRSKNAFPPRTRRQPWTQTEDAILFREVLSQNLQNGTSRILWNEVVLKLPGRNGQSARNRYNRLLDTVS